MPTSTWTKPNKTYILFGTTFTMPPPPSSTPTNPPHPRVLLFDIGGVVVVSPFQAIINYERSHKIPQGWINHSIAASAPHGAWQRLERGEIFLDEQFYEDFRRDLTDEKRWRVYYAKSVAAQKGEDQGQAAEEAAYQAPPPPSIDAEELYWSMMHIARKPDPYMYPALQRLREAADENPGTLVLAAMSNTSIFPEGHAFNDPATADGRFHAEMRGLFDVFVSSAHVGMRKPHEDIYYYTLGRVGEFAKQKGWDGDAIRVGDVTFLDDIGSNLKTGRKVGFGTIRVTLGRVQEAVEELEGITGLVLLDGSKAKL